jgi:hypothetical protein
MATLVLTDAKVYVAQFNLSGDLKATRMEYGAEPQDETVFGDDTRSMKGGLKTVQLSHEGLWSGGTGNVDDVLWSRIGIADVPVTVSPDGGDAGEVAYLFNSNHAEYEPQASIGELLRFNVTANATGSLVRGTVMRNSTEIATADGTGFQVGAVSATQRIYGALHVITASAGDTLDVIVESDAGDNWVGSEATRLTFTQITAATPAAEWKSAAGAITDQWWRAAWTIGGSDPSFEFFISIGIL